MFKRCQEFFKNVVVWQRYGGHVKRNMSSFSAAASFLESITESVIVASHTMCNLASRRRRPNTLLPPGTIFHTITTRPGIEIESPFRLTEIGPICSPWGEHMRFPGRGSGCDCPYFLFFLEKECLMISDVTAKGAEYPNHNA